MASGPWELGQLPAQLFMAAVAVAGVTLCMRCVLHAGVAVQIACPCVDCP